MQQVLEDHFGITFVRAARLHQPRLSFRSGRPGGEWHRMISTRQLQRGSRSAFGVADFCRRVGPPLIPFASHPVSHPGLWEECLGKGRDSRLFVGLAGFARHPESSGRPPCARCLLRQGGLRRGSRFSSLEHGSQALRLQLRGSFSQGKRWPSAPDHMVWPPRILVWPQRIHLDAEPGSHCESGPSLIPEQCRFGVRREGVLFP
jgi:hypothetical protein